jgi:DNA-binding CsgD family transcriptional regulator
VDTTTEWQPSGASDLTALQREIIRLIVAGRTNAQIADRLGMTPGGVGTQVGRLVERLGLTCRADIPPWATGRPR